jgi:hypothetical protein
MSLFSVPKMTFLLFTILEYIIECEKPLKTVFSVFSWRSQSLKVLSELPDTRNLELLVIAKVFIEEL